ncbi:MAG: DNA polymerase I, partial [Candidatus Dormibacteria bacterium]
MGDTLLLIDGHALVYRAFFAMPALTNSRGDMTNAAFGFTSMLLKAFTEHNPSHAIAAFDPPGPTFRHDEFADYKAQRPAMPEGLRPQVPWCREIIDALNIPMVEMARYEADDVIGALSVQADNQGMDVLILTGDLDALQLVTKRVRVFASRRGITDTIVYDLDRVFERYGFAPPLVADFKALQGDVSDNIPGVPGIGSKTAMALVQEHGPLESILAAVPSMKEGKIKRLLTEYADQALHSKRMATIVRDLDVPLDIAGARLRDYEPERVRELFDRLEFRSLFARLPEADRLGRLERAPAAQEAPPAQGSLTLDAVPPPSTEVIVLREPSEVESALATLRHAGAVAVRSVCEGPSRGGDIVGIALAAGDRADRAYYVPLAPGAGGDAVANAAAVGRLLADPAVATSGYDLKQDVLAWEARGMSIAGLRLDLMLAAYLCITTRTRVPTLTVLAEDLCGIHSGLTDDIIGTGRHRRRHRDIPVEEMAAHAGRLAALVPQVQPKLEAGLEEGRLRALHDDIELPLVPILATMEITGIAVDGDRLEGLRGELSERIVALESEIHHCAAEPFNVGSTQQLARVLYDELGLAAGRRTKTGRSTDADTLELLREEHPVVDLILEWRQLTKLKGTYVDALPLLCSADGRIHSSFNQAVATTGRLSSADPNLQNVPIRTTWGQRIRQAFVAGPGRRLVSADYSQIELRVLAHVSGEQDLIDAFHRGEDIHRRTAAEVCGIEPAEVTPD